MSQHESTLVIWPCRVIWPRGLLPSSQEQSCSSKVQQAQMARMHSITSCNGRNGHSVRVRRHWADQSVTGPCQSNVNHELEAQKERNGHSTLALCSLLLLFPLTPLTCPYLPRRSAPLPSAQESSSCCCPPSFSFTSGTRKLSAT